MLLVENYCACLYNNKYSTYNIEEDTLIIIHRWFIILQNKNGCNQEYLRRRLLGSFRKILGKLQLVYSEKEQIIKLLNSRWQIQFFSYTQSACAHTHTHTHTHTHIYIYIYIYIHTHAHTQTQPSSHYPGFKGVLYLMTTYCLFFCPSRYSSWK